MKLDRTAFDFARARKCIGISKLAKAANVSSGTIYAGFERNIDPVTIGKLAKALDVDVTEIIVKEQR